MKKIVEFFQENDHFARHCGMILLKVAPGYAEVEMKIEAYHKNGAGTVHGGAIFTLADYAFAVAANSHGKQAVAINTSISFVKSVTKGTLCATARELSINRKLGNYEVQIVDDEKHLIGQFLGTAFRKEAEVPPR